MRKAYLAAACVVMTVTTAVPAQADAPRRVTYVVTADSPVTADIYYREAEPPSWADYSHNPYLYSPKAQVDVGPDRPWVREVVLTDPDRWAMVSATSGRLPAEPGFRCELRVDDVVVATGEGPKGALCSLRHW